MTTSASRSAASNPPRWPSSPAWAVWFLPDKAPEEPVEGSGSTALRGEGGAVAV